MSESEKPETRMQDEKEKLREVLNLRIGEVLASEIERVAERRGQSASEVARTLLSYGAEVERRLEAQKLTQPYWQEYGDEVAGRIVISAEFVPYTWAEAAEIRERLEAGGGQQHPTWGDLTP